MSKLSTRKLIYGLKIFIVGIVRGLMMLIIFVILIPNILNTLMSQTLQTEITKITLQSITYLLDFLFFFVALETLSIINKGNILGFIFNSLSKVMGILFIIYAFNEGIIENTIDTNGFSVTIKIDLTPILLIIIAYFFASLIYSSISIYYKE